MGGSPNGTCGVYHVNPESVSYLLDRQCSRQWKKFLAALAAEFASQIDVGELRALMKRIGTRFAVNNPIPPCTSITEIQGAMSAVWLDSEWGWVEVDEVDRAMRIVHQCAPLWSAFGPESVDWTPAFLEGVYQQWLVALGAGDLLRVRQVTRMDEFGRIEFRLSQD